MPKKTFEEAQSRKETMKFLHNYKKNISTLQHEMVKVDKPFLEKFIGNRVSDDELIDAQTKLNDLDHQLTSLKVERQQKLLINSLN